ncbi:MAG TPA: CCA tRNA nucleotidyltransferase [Rhodospirillaceae bacterium]|nr:CCA tRNA nucleotidyltransferase [Rhodospirillaceae bacterium]
MPAARLLQDWMTAPETEAVMKALTSDGAEARFIGGCVRDAVLERPIKDIDIATSAIPEVVLDLLGRAEIKAVPTGLRHGTVTAIFGKKTYEITTLRRDLKTDGRHAVVGFTDDWHEDAMRRDFTMNTLSLTADGTLYDTASGYDDAMAGRIRFVGDAETRIKEDVLRLLRFYRFYAYYGAAPADEEARSACQKLAPLLPGLSGERISQELLNLLAAPNPIETLTLMHEDGIFHHCLEEAENFERLEALLNIEISLLAKNDDNSPDAGLRLAALVTSEPDKVLGLAQRLKFPNALRDRLLAFSETPVPDEDLPRALYRFGTGSVRDRLLLAWAERSLPDDASTTLDRIHNWTQPEFPLSGKDGLAAGLKAGPDLGRHLEQIEEWWVERDFAPDRNQCLEKLQAIISSI